MRICQKLYGVLPHRQGKFNDWILRRFDLRKNRVPMISATRFCVD